MTEDITDIVMEWSVTEDVKVSLNGPQGPGDPPIGVFLHHGDRQVAFIGLVGGANFTVLNAMLLGLNGLETYRETLGHIRQVVTTPPKNLTVNHLARQVRNIIDGHEHAMVRLVDTPTPRRTMVVEAPKPKLWAPGDP